MYEQESFRVNGKVKTKTLKYIGKFFGEAGYRKADEIQTVAKQKRRLYKDPEMKRAVKAVEKLYNRGYTSKNYYFKDGDYTEARRIIQDKIIDSFINNDNAFVSNGKPTIVFLGGPPGSGKTKRLSYLFDKSKFVVINADDIKALLPEYKGVNAPLLHDESVDIASRLFEKALVQNKNILYDATLKSFDKGVKKINLAKSMGYNVKLYGTNLDKKITLNNAVKRAIKSNRYVPIKHILDTTDKTNESVLKLSKYVDEYKIFDTSVKKNEPPKIIIEGFNNAS